MAVAQPTLFTAKAHEAIQMAKQKNESFFVSEIIKVHSINPVGFYEAGKSSFQGERFFWKNADHSLQLIGLGNVYSILSEEDSGRFAQVESEWQKFKGRVIVTNGQDRAKGIGPVLFGGFAFDPKKRGEDIWTHFPNALFFVPNFLLTIHNQTEMYVTVTFVCKPDDEDTIGARAHEKLQQLLEKSNLTLDTNEPTLQSQQEVEPILWKNSVSKAIDSLKNNELGKVVLSRQLKLQFDSPISDAQLLSTLTNEQKDSFVFGLNWQGSSFIGATPERLVKKEGDFVQSTSLAGSIKRGDSPEEDDSLGQWLLNDQKNSLEHQYVVQQISETFTKLCKETHVSDSPGLLKMRDIQHIYTGINGQVLHHVSLLDFVERLHPTPALGGTPKSKALKMIRDLEPMDRGYYASPIGWCDYDDNGEFVVGIRSGLVQQEMVTLYAGCGIVADSDSEKEYEETKIKFRPMLTALGGMQR